MAFALAVVALLAQAAPVVIGSDVRAVTREDVAAITTAVAPNCTPWVIEALAGGRNTVVPTPRVTVACASMDRTGRVTRGALLDLAKTNRERGLWAVERTRTWAHVGAAVSDVRAPFWLDGTVADDELLTLVALIRSSPEVPDSRPARRRVPGDLRMSWVRRVTGDRVEVSLRESADSYYLVTIDRVDGRWRAVSMGLLIVDEPV